MKKLLIWISLAVLGLHTPLGFALEKNLTVGETLTLYFSEIFPNLTEEINDVIVKYSGVGNRAGLRTALQKAIYYGMLPNTAMALDPDRPMSDRAFSQLLRKHFGVRLPSDDTLLTQEDYETFMVPLRTSFAYRVLQLLNTPESTMVSEEVTPSESRFSNADNYYLLEQVYSVLKDNYLSEEKFNQADLIYGATEGLVNELGDSHTRFFRPDASTDFKNSLDGTIVGIGVIIDVDAHGSLLITDVIRHSPAEKAGIVAGDRITRINDIAVTTEDGIVEEIGFLRGREGTQVDVTVLSGKITRTLPIIREIIHIQLVETDILENSYKIIF